MSTFSVPIVTVKSVTKHPNADALDLIEFEEVGWRCVDKIGAREVGNFVVYVPIDSKVKTSRPEFEFLKPRAKADGTSRIRTIRLRGEVSQGILLNVTTELLQWITENELKKGPVEKINVINYDVAEYFEIIKYEPPVESIPPLSAGNFPVWCEKSDAERYQNYNRSIEPYIDDYFTASIKVDGMSTTIFYDAETDHVGVCSRNWEVKEFDEGANKWVEGDKPKNTNIYWQIAYKYNLLSKVKEIATTYNIKRFAIQGEICGPGIQKNKMGLTETTFFAFDMYNGDISEFLSPSRFQAYCMAFQIPMVKEIYFGPIREHVEEKFTYVSELKYDNDTPAEGVVYIAMKPTRIGTLGRLKFKYINPEFLLKYE